MENERQTTRWILLVPIVVLVIAILAIIFVLWDSQPAAPQSPTALFADTQTIQSTNREETLVVTSQTPVNTNRPDSTSTPELSFIAIVIVDDVPVYSGPAETYDVIARIENRTALRVIGISPDKEWFFILLPDNRQGWIRIETVAYDFDIDLLPVVIGTATPTAPYGQGMLVPPHLLGITPGLPSTPGRSVLSLVAVLTLLVLLVSVVQRVPGRSAYQLPKMLSRAIQFLFSLH